MAATQLGVFTGTNYFGMAVGTWLAGRIFGVLDYRLVYVVLGAFVVLLSVPLGSIDIPGTQRLYQTIRPVRGESAERESARSMGNR